MNRPARLSGEQERLAVMTRNAVVTYAKQKIRVHAILPGLKETKMGRDQQPDTLA